MFMLLIISLVSTINVNSAIETLDLKELTASVTCLTMFLQMKLSELPVSISAPVVL